MRSIGGMPGVVLVGVACVALCGPLGAQVEVPSVVCVNPIAGFSITIPEDWGMGSGTLKDTVMGINYPLYPSFCAPVISFARAPGTAQEMAQVVALCYRPLSAAPPQVRPTGRGEEWEVTATIDGGLMGPLACRWLCRKDGNVGYVVSAMVGTQYAATFAEEIDTALDTCRPIKQGAILHYLREPSMDAFRMILPYGWRYEGHIYSGVNCPAAYVYKIQSPDGLSGCFFSQPVEGHMANPTLEMVAGEVVLPALREDVPDVQLERFHRLPRAAMHFTHFHRFLSANTLNINADRAFADYLGTSNGVAIRIRVNLWLNWMATLPGMAPYGHVMMRGEWAPVARFDELYPLARGVQASLWETPKWRKLLLQTTKEVLDYRKAVFEHAAEEWDAYIRSVDRIVDPATGEYQEVPMGAGDVVKDLDGKMHRLPEGAEVPAGATRVRQQ